MGIQTPFRICANYIELRLGLRALNLNYFTSTPQLCQNPQAI